MTFRQYFNRDFQPDLARLLGSQPEWIRACAHCRAPATRRLLVDLHDHVSGARTAFAATNDAFRFAFYVVTLLDQTIHAHFRPRHPQWLVATGGYPLPVSFVGYGCVRVAQPPMLLPLPLDDSGRIVLWDDVVDLVVGDLNQLLPEMVGISPDEFADALAREHEFGAGRAATQEAQLLAALRCLRRAPDGCRP